MESKHIKNKIKRYKHKGIQTGDTTHTQDQLIYPVNLSPTNRIRSNVERGIFMY